MKKWIALCLALLLLAGNLVSALADSESFDLSVIQSDEYLNIDVDAENNVAFVSTVLSPKDNSFTHECNSIRLYSTIEMDMVILHYNDSDAYPVLRLCVNLSTDDGFKDISAITFKINGYDYTFSDIANENWYYTQDNSYRQMCMIKFGMANSDFFTALEKLTSEVLEKANSSASTETDWSQEMFTMVLHGTRDIKASVPLTFALEFWTMEKAYVLSNGVNSMNKVNATPMEKTESK